MYQAAHLRGLAYLMAHRGQEAAVEFQKILDHPGIVVNQPIGALAHLGLARAYALQGDTCPSPKLWPTAESTTYNNTSNR